MDGTPSTLGAVIRERRIALGLTQEQLAESISDESEYVRQSEISRIEAGRVLLPRRIRLERIAHVLGFSLLDLLLLSTWGEDEDNPPVDDADPYCSCHVAETSAIPGSETPPPAWTGGQLQSSNFDQDTAQPSRRDLSVSLFEENRRQFEANRMRFEDSRKRYLQRVGQVDSQDSA